MQVSKEFLLEAVGLSMVVILILISMQIFQRAVKITEVIEKEQEQQLIELEEYEIIKFDGLQIDGMTVINYIKRMTGTYNLPVHVETVKGEFTVSEKKQYSNLRNVESEQYINPFAKYRCEVVRDENEVITNIKIKLVKDGI